MIDMAILTVPKIEVRAPLVGPALLKSYLEQYGFEIKCYDLNEKLWNRMRPLGYGHLWHNNDRTFTADDEKWNIEYDKIREHTDALIDDFLAEMEEEQPEFIGLSVLSYWNHKFTKHIIDRLQGTEYKIVVGGPGVENLGQELLDEGKIYAYIYGEGEKPLLNLLMGNEDTPGINNKKQSQLTKDELNAAPFPDFTDIDFSLYSHLWRNPIPEPKGSEVVYVTNSRGCVRRCTFCDVPHIWPTFSWKDGERMADELEDIVTKHPNITHFEFTDSLINGNMKAFPRLIEELCKRDLNITWGGQFIVRNQKQQPPEMWDMMKESGLTYMMIGVESFSEKIVKDMNKGYKVTDFNYTMEQLDRTGIKLVMMMIIGYPTETEKEFLENLKWLDDNQKYVKSGTIATLSLGSTLKILPNTPLAHMFPDLPRHTKWELGDNTVPSRIERWFRMRDYAKERNYPLVIETPKWMIELYEKYTGIDLSKKYEIIEGKRTW